MSRLSRLAPLALAAFVLPLGAPRPAPAMCPPCGLEPQRIVIADPQRVYVFHRAGLQDLILESAYRGNAKDFGMILPVPSVPDVRMVQHGFFDAMTRAAGQFEKFREERAGSGLSAAAEDATWRTHVQVVRRQVAGVFSAVTLKARTLEALENWLRENSYRYADDAYARQVFQKYIDQQWYFLAVQVRVEEAGGQFDGRFRPMGIRFRSKDIVIPTRVASIYPNGMPFEFYVVTNRAVDFPKAWGDGRKAVLPLSSAKIMAEADLMRELEGEAFFSATDELPALAEAMKSRRPDEYARLLERKLSGMYLSVFTGFFSREQLSGSDLVFEGQDRMSSADVDRCVGDFGSGDIELVKRARVALELAGSGHVATLVKHLSHPDAQVRIAVAKVLGGLGEPGAVPGLVETLDLEREPLTRMALQNALRDITGVAGEFDAAPWRDWWARWEKEGRGS